MAIDGLFIHVIKENLSSLIGAHIKKIHSLSPFEIALDLSGAAYRTLVLNLDSNTNRIYLSNNRFSYREPTNFVMLLRKTILQGKIVSIEQADLDRVLTFTIEARNEIGLKETYRLIVELMGKYANCILCDSQGKILDCLKRIQNFDSRQRILMPGVEYEYPGRPEKLNPFNKSIIQKADLSLDGFSPLLAREFNYRMEQGASFHEILDELVHSTTIYQSKNQFHLIELTHLQIPATRIGLFEGLDSLYRTQEENHRRQVRNRKLFQTIEREIKKNERKIPKLSESYEQSLDYQKYSLYGDLLFQNLGVKKSNPLPLYDYQSESTIEVPIDMRFDLKTNANLHYKKYHKLKRSLDVLTEQIEKAKTDLDYYQLLKDQSELADQNDLDEIKEELENRRVMIPEKRKGKKKKGPAILHFRFNDAEIWVGKNNLQNDQIVSKIARKSDWWFHVKDYHGSHVLVRTENLDEPVIRLAAMIASEFSKSRFSSSVPVNYTRFSNIRKVPKAQKGFVTMKSYQTIYIDPEHEKIRDFLASVKKI